MEKINLVDALSELDEDLVVKGVKSQLAENVPAIEILGQLQKGMEKVGKFYEEGEYYLSELIMSADIFSSVADLLKANMAQGAELETHGTIVLGTVKDDIHDIGKNIVATILGCNGYKVVDVGVDVPIEKFVEAVKEHKPQVVGMCCLLTTAFDAMKDTVAAVKAENSAVKILIGGGPCDNNVAKYCSADYYCKTAYDAVTLMEGQCKA
ncbi:MAG: metH 6 [Firmicutes bacterium]|nr:metH 6 [Bacillota bacterium]